MKKFRFGAAAAALALVVGLFTLAVPDAKAASVQLVNGNFSNGINGWTATPFVGPNANVEIDSNVDRSSVDISLGFYNYLVLGCSNTCPGSGSNKLSQTLNGLVPGDQYRVTFYTIGINNGSGSWTAAGPLYVQLGSQISDRIDVPYITDPNKLPTYKRVEVDFRYSGPGSSAVLSLIEQFSGLTHGVPCVPCLPGGEGISILNASMEDLSPPGPALKVQKALGTGGRINSADQFLLAIRNATTNAALNCASTSGTGSAVTSAAVSITPDTTTSYKVTEEMATGSSSATTQYTASLSCSNANSSGTQIPSTIKVGDNFPLLKAGDDISCTLTNTAKPVAAATLQIRQSVLSPVPPNLLPPYTFQYTGNNGWSAPAITNTALNQPQSSAPIALNATGVATTVSTKLPDNRWFVAAFSCSDLSAPASGNPTGTLVKSTTPTVTIPASFVRPGATLRCAMALGHATP